MSGDPASRENRIESILLETVSYPSFSNANEPCIEEFFASWFAGIPYFKSNPGHCGFYPLGDDHLNRRVPWCLLKGKTARTVVLLHHHDVVDTLDFGRLESLALKPYQVTQAYREGQRALSPEIRRDVESGDWLFGRGVADMKGGAAIQLALLEEYAAEEDFPGNIVLVSVPDEENLSAGMMGAVCLLRDLQTEHGLEYYLMLNCEPHTRAPEESPVLTVGSIGKLLPVFYVRGK
ncbi:MAG: M20/M25/M40 family metallo-hydrolase, partial [Symbiobacteriaceae bacterium]|nr:M20/M25/M40 family metallo-hydrolase [Symbiobacteriaceae bacterium]